MILIAALSALLPAGLLFWYICRRDRIQPEPAGWLWKAVWYGVLSALVAIFLETLISLPVRTLALSDFQNAVVTAFFNAAVPEEAAKMLMLWLVLRKNPHFDEHLDGVVYATCVGLGFAGFENLLYIFENLDNLVQIAVARGLFAVPGHFFFAVVMGYHISLAKFSSASDSQRRGNMLKAYFVPVLLHGIYDSLLMSADALPFISSLLVIVFLLFCNRTRKDARTRIRRMIDMDRNIHKQTEI